MKGTLMLLNRIVPEILSKDVKLILLEDDNTDYLKYKVNGFIRTKFSNENEIKKPFLGGTFFTCFLPDNFHENLHTKLIESKLFSNIFEKVLFGAGFNYTYFGKGLYHSFKGEEKDVYKIIAASNPGHMSQDTLNNFNSKYFIQNNSFNLKWIKYPKVIFSEEIFDYLNGKIIYDEQTSA